MHFKDAAFEILKQANKPLHYKEITELAKAANLIEWEGITPEASMGSLLYTDTLNPDSRFRRGDTKGTFTLRVVPHTNIDQQIFEISQKVRKDLLKHLHQMLPTKFEELIKLLLVEMGFEEIELTPVNNDRGIDVRGILRSNQLSSVKIAIQAKRWQANVGSDVVRNLRGSLRVAESEQGLIITPSNFTPEARNEANAEGKTPINLINGNQLVDLLIQYKVGVIQEQYIVPSIDTDYWADILGVTLENEPVHVQPTSIKESATQIILFPLKIKATHNGQEYFAELLNIEGKVLYNNQVFAKATQAAKTITTDWKSVSGWDFWHYQNPKSGKWIKISKLRKSK